MGQLLRQAEDWYVTPPECTTGILGVETFRQSIWEPACGDGAISEVLKEKGHKVLSTDLIDRGYISGKGGMDFLKTSINPGYSFDIVTNPPYKLAEQFIDHAHHLGAGKVAMLLRLAFLEGVGRRDRLFASRPPARVWVMSKRPTLWHGADPAGRKTTGGATAYAWFVWEPVKPAAAATELGWI